MEMNEGRKIRWYEVVYVLVLLGLLAWGIFFMNPHKVAIVDLDRVFKDLGVAQKIERAHQKLPVFTKATQMLEAYKVRVKGLQEKMAEAKTQADKDKIAAQLKSADEQFSQTIAPMQNELQRFDNLAVASFRKRISTFVDQVALKKGVDVILMNGPNVGYYNPKVELTSDVTEAAREFFSKDMPLIDPALEKSRGSR